MAIEGSTRWLPALDPHAPLAEAAAIVIGARVDELRRRMGAVTRGAPAEGKGASEEDVKRVRVAARRVAAAVRGLETTLEKDLAARLRRRVTEVRRVAGRVRDCDVQGELLGQIANGKSQIANSDREMEDAGAIVALQGVGGDGRGGGMRRVGRRVLEGIAKTRARRVERLAGVILERGPEIERLARALLRRLESARPSARAGGERGRARSLLDAARAPLARLAGDARASAEADLTIPANLHGLRLACKRLRYMVEVFAGCFPARLRAEMYPALVEVQDRIGAATDLDGLISRLEREAAAARREEDGEARALSSLAERYRGVYEARCREAAAFLRSGGLEVVKQVERLVRGGVGVAENEGPLLVVRRIGMSGAAEGNGSAGVVAAEAGPKAAPVVVVGGERSVRMAVIDVGTNSIRLEVVDAYPDRTYRVLDDEKETARLGAGMHKTGVLAKDAMERAVNAIARMAAIAAGHRVGPGALRAIGTYAVREARNREEFLTLVRDRTGIDVLVLGPEQEAKFAFLSAEHAFDALAEGTGAVIDIGGGSTEVVLSAAGVPELVYGMPLGAMLLTERFGGPAKASLENFKKMRRYIDGVLEEHIGKPLLHPQLVVGTGGTFGVLASVLSGAGGGAGGAGWPQLWDRRVGFEATRGEIKHIVERIRRVAPEERGGGAIAGLPSDRADIIVAGFTIVERALKHLRANAVRVHDRGIRDGVILSMIAEAFPDSVAGAGRATDPMGAVRRLAQKCNYEQAHSEHVTRLALSIFDQLVAKLGADRGGDDAGAEWASPESRRVLEAAAVLHDIGYLVSYSGHHKHSYHLIVHSELAGSGLFSAREVELIANIARYHRRAEPRKGHRAFARLERGDRELVRRLAGVLRVADGLDRTHTQRVSGARVEIGRGVMRLYVGAAGDVSADLWGSAEKRSLFERAFGMRCDYRLEAGERAGAPAMAAS